MHLWFKDYHPKKCTWETKFKFYTKAFIFYIAQIP